MAAYRGSSSTRCGGRSGSRPNPASSSPAASAAARSAARSSTVARTQSASESAGSELSSSCPPGSVVSGAPDGSTPGEELVGSPGAAANPDMASVIRYADPPRRPGLQADAVNVLGRRLLTELAPTEPALIDDRHGFTLITATDIPV